MLKQIRENTDMIKALLLIITTISYLVILFFLDSFSIILTVMYLFIVWVVAFDHSLKLPEKYSQRSFQARTWKRSFPDVNNDDIRQFLILLTDAFGFEEKEKLQFNPDDTIMEIYQAVYPRIGGADNLEIESFACYFEDVYQIDLQKIDIDIDSITLGELFHIAKKNRK